MKQWIETFAKTHLFYLILIGVGLIAFRTWLAEHDARLKADSTVKEAQAQINGLKSQLASVEADRAATVKALQAKASVVKTPEAAVAGIPDVSSLTVTRIPNTPQVSVDAVQLYQELNTCAVAKVNLSACEKSEALKDQELGDKDQQIAALKQKPRFWKRFTGTLKTVAVTAGVTAVVTAVMLAAHGGI